MLLLSKELYQIPVHSLQTGGTIAVTESPIINPRSLKIIGWWCTGEQKTKSILLTEDVRETTAHGLLVNDHTALSQPEDLVRLQEILEIKFELLGKIVKTKNRKLGKIYDYCFNEGYVVQKLYVSQSIVKALDTDTLIVDRSRILEVTDSYVLVGDNEVKSTQAVPLPKFVGKFLGTTN